MLYNLSWLQQNKQFPPTCEKGRIERYKQNASLFDGDHFSSSVYRHHGECTGGLMELYERCSRRISRVVGNFEEVISFPVLLNYHRLMSLKIADLVCGEPPVISGGSVEANDSIRKAREFTEFDSKLYSSVIDISRYGECIQRIYKDEVTGKYTFTNWDPTEWFPIVSQDGTYSILKHCLVWIEDLDETDTRPDLRLHVQIHDTVDVGKYEHRVYKISSGTGTIGKLEHTEWVQTGLDVCAVSQVKSYSVTGSVYGYDDYMPIDSVLAEIMSRIGQISVILDKHADPNITGPASMLSRNEVTGELYLRPGKFFAVSPGEDQPSYMTWEGQLSAAFQQLELLINQLYIVSEMGSAILGDSASGSQAISGTAMRFKMAGPLAKARRVSNSLSLTVKNMFQVLTQSPGQTSVEKISVFWQDGLPDDPRENVEIAKLATGEEKLMPLDAAIREYFKRTDEEAADWVSRIEEDKIKSMGMMQEAAVNKSGPQNGTGINPNKKGSSDGMNNPVGQQNRNQDTNRSNQASSNV